MRSWIAAGTLALVLAVGLALPAEAAHRHSRTCGHRYSYSYGYSDPYAYGYSDRYRYPTYNYNYNYDYGYRYRYNSVPYGYDSPYRYGAPYVLYAPPPPAYGYYYAPYRRHVRPRVSVTLGLW